MRLRAMRATISGAMTLLLLCVLAFGPVCAVLCETPMAAGHGCCAGESHAASMPMAASHEAMRSDDCHGTVTAEASQVSITTQASIKAQAVMTHCAVDLSVAATGDRGFDPATIHAAAQVVLSMQAWAVAAPPQRVFVRGAPPPSGLPGFHPSIVSLRV